MLVTQLLFLSFLAYGLAALDTCVFDTLNPIFLSLSLSDLTVSVYVIKTRSTVRFGSFASLAGHSCKVFRNANNFNIITSVIRKYKANQGGVPSDLVVTMNTLFFKIQQLSSRWPYLRIHMCLQGPAVH